MKFSKMKDRIRGFHLSVSFVAMTILFLSQNVLSAHRSDGNFSGILADTIAPPTTGRDCPPGTHLKIFWPKIEVWWVLVIAKWWDTIKFCEPNDYLCTSYNKKTQSCDYCGMLILKMHDFVNGNYCHFDNWNWPLVIIGKFFFNWQI